MNWLLHIEGKTIVRPISLTENRYSLGRGKENGIQFDTPEVSRVHALLQKADEGYTILINSPPIMCSSMENRSRNIP